MDLTCARYMIVMGYMGNQTEKGWRDMCREIAKLNKQTQKPGRKRQCLLAKHLEKSDIPQD